MSGLSDDLATAIRSVAKDWKAAKRRADKKDRVRSSDLYRVRHYKTYRPPKVTMRDAAFEVMEQAYMAASAGGTLPANARQIMYAARPGVLKLTDGKCWKNSSYFTQILLPQYIEQTSVSWDVVWDARGQLLEPHTGRRIPLGGLGVRRYVADWRTDMPTGIQLAPSIDTVGPANRYSYALFIEKEGFHELFRATRLAERYDLAIMSTKGMSVVAARQLVGRLSLADVTILVVRDFDKAGFSIVHTLSHSTRRHQFYTHPNVIDLGLRLSDVQEMELQSEPVTYHTKKDPKENLRERGATEEECAFLVHPTRGYRGGWEGKRVELNAMTSDQLMTWLEAKLDKAGATKLVPNEDALKAAYLRAKRVQTAQKMLDGFSDDGMEIPPNLSGRIHEMIDGGALSWDEAIFEIAKNGV